MSRRNARAVAMQALYQFDTGLIEPRAAFAFALEFTTLSAADEEYALFLFTETTSRQSEIDTHLRDALAEWSLDRLTRVDRSLLRLAVAELMLRQPDVPVGVVIDECIELAKVYSTDDSSRFVNGILGAVVRRLGMSST